MLIARLVALVAIVVAPASGVVSGCHSKTQRGSPPAASSAAVPNTPVAPASAGSTTSPSSTPNGGAALTADFAQLKSKLQAVIGIAVSAVGAGQVPITLGDWEGGTAWSTIKIPLAIADLRKEDPPEITDTMRAAITESDNAAAEAIWADLGDPVTAAHKVEDVLRETGDPTIVQSQRVRPEFTAFGQTDWSLTNQVRFTSTAVCEGRNEPIFALMGQIEHDQSWGIGTIRNTRFKGGWGPSLSGSYLVRQIGVLTGPAGMTAVALAAQPASGSFSDGIQDLNDMATWLTAHLGALPAGQCG